MRFLLLAVLLILGRVAHADYDDYCYEMATKLANDPSAMKLGELDGLKSCIQELQRAGVVMHKRPAAAKKLECPKPDLDALCPKPDLARVCPGYMEKIERQKQKSKQEKEDKKKYKPVIQAF